MKRLTKNLSAAVLATTFMLFATPLVAQQIPAADQATAASADAAPAFTLTEVQAQLAALEANSGIEDAVKQLLRPKYQQAIESLKQAEEYAAKTVAYREAVTKAPLQIAELREQLKDLPAVQNAAAFAPDGSVEDLQKEIDSRRSALNIRNEELSKLTSDLTSIKRRPLEISARLPEAQRELPEIDAKLEDFSVIESSPGRIADRILLQANASKLQSELEMLRQEKVSISVREELLQAQHNLLTREIENDSAALKSLQKFVHSRLTKEAEVVGSMVDRMVQDLPAGDEAAHELAAEVKALAKEFDEVSKASQMVASAQDQVASWHKLLSEEYQSIRDQVELGGTGEALAHILLDVHKRVLDPGANAVKLTGVPTLDETNEAAWRVKRQIDAQPAQEARFADRSSPVVQSLVATRHELLVKLKDQYRNLIQDVTMLKGNQQQYREQADEVRNYISEQLFWMRSSPPVDGATLTGIPSGLRWLLRRQHWEQLARAVSSLVARTPITCLAWAVAVVALVLMRPHIIVALEQTGVEIRRISTDRYALTVQALLWTILLAAPVPLVFGFLWWTTEQWVGANDWLRGVTVGSMWATQITFVFGFLAALCRPGGLGAAHFGLIREPLDRLRPTIFWFIVVYIPALLVTSSALFGSQEHAGSVGRASFILAHLWTAIVLWRVFRIPTKAVQPVDRDKSVPPISKWQYLCGALIIACPLALVVMAWRGYLITAARISGSLLATMGLVLGGLTLYWMAVRWFGLKKRKLALAEAIKRRQARREAAATSGQEESKEVISVVPEDEQELDLDSISEQTRHLLRLLFSLGTAIAILWLWSDSIPLIKFFDKIPVAGTLTLFDLARAIVIVIVTWIASRDVPGLLELSVLRSKFIEPGTRYAISTLCQYVLIAVGVFALFQVLHVDWTKFGWIAAALSVGLGFGLQEVVANFVCGLILLFEQPIRVGDVITVESVTGTVTKIQMRATTITNWDRQELVVPNKTLITNSVLNWTLSSSTNRLVISVGAAYGSDTKEALQILLDVAANHPTILEEPAPIASFEQFADSTLTLVLRAYLPNLDNRLKTITELHAEIDKRFAAAGIEIAYPQCDVHLKGPGGILP